MDLSQGALQSRDRLDIQIPGRKGRQPGGRAEKALPPPLDLSSHFSATTKHRDASNIKKFYKYLAIPGVSNIASGTDRNCIELFCRT